MSPAVRSVLDRLEEASQRWWVFSLFSRFVAAITVSLSILMAFVVADSLLRLPHGGLLVLFGLWVLGTLGLLVATLRRGIRRQRTVAAAARRVELAFPELGSHLINLVQLISTSDAKPEAFRLAAIEDAAVHVAKIPIDQVPSRHTRRERWRLGIQTPRDLLEACGMLGAVILMAVALNVALPTWASSIQRLFTPWQYVPQVGSVRILEVIPGNTVVLVGARLDISARVDVPEGTRPEAVLEVWDEQGMSTRTLLPDAAYRRVTATIPAVMRPIRYHLQIGDSESDVYQVRIEQKPTVREVVIAYRYPAYVDLAPRTVTQKQGDLEAPQYTEVQLTILSTSKLSKGHLRVDGHDVPGRVSDDGRSLIVTMVLERSTTYTIHLVNLHGHTDEQPRVNSIAVVEDARPTVVLTKPARDTNVVAGGKLPVIVRATDDYGLANVQIEWKLAEQPDGEMELHVAHRWKQDASATACTLQYALVEPFLDRKADAIILVRAVAYDCRQVRLPSGTLGPQQAASSWRRITVIDLETQLSDRAARLDSLQSELWAILQIQIRARVRTAQLSAQQHLEQAHQDTKAIRETQVQIRQRSEILKGRIDTNAQPDQVMVKRSLATLVAGPMAKAVAQAEQAARVTHVDQLKTPVPELMETQDEIIEQLRKLLQVTRRAAVETLDKMAKRPGGDLPPDVKAKLETLRDELQEFIKQQKRVIEATKNLAKKPVEDFTEEDEQAMKELAEAEDEWARFMEEVHSDFSKLPEQDFANPSALEEMVEIQTELKMAKDALTKKTADIAVPLEQLGAEMAEEMTTNIEKWLPDTPDRERWSQEESLSDDMKEAPMAELPGELEDLVGELMEEEEDLMDEMEDVSSSAADSLDKGAGWDAMDGPISNMSARGVTGNRLPNSSEIGGRSGEGRQGKASGEFVSDTAVGKGGRKTPSRLAPDPFVKGQVKDISKDPVGGATGGGKESGAGGEGLEGPLRRQVQRDMKRLAKRQAELRNKAEAIDLKFRVMNYHHTDLEKLIETMATVERDLRSGRYRNALRHRKILLDGLGNVKSYVDGEQQVRQDRSSNLPASIQREILSSMQDASPHGWEELNRRYFQRLATGDEKNDGTDASASATASKTQTK